MAASERPCSSSKSLGLYRAANAGGIDGQKLADVSFEEEPGTATRDSSDTKPDDQAIVRRTNLVQH
jgi:hypothetical protein